MYLIAHPILPIEKGINYVVSNIRWSVELDADNIHRRETPEVPVSAIREAIINSFVHARFDLPINNEICVYSNRISITNPGSFASDYKPEDFANNELNSNLRNELIAKTLYLCKDVESFGSGLRKIYRLCNDANVTVSYLNNESAFTLEFSRVDRNVAINVAINVVLTDMEKRYLSCCKMIGPCLQRGYLSSLEKRLEPFKGLLNHCEEKD